MKNFVDEIRVGVSPRTTTPKFRAAYGRVFEKAYNSIRDHLKISDIKGAVIQARTGLRTVASNGKPYDHLGEVQDAVNSINTGLREAAKLWKQSWLSQGDREALQAAQSYLQQAKNELQQIMTRDGAAGAIAW
ncbi:MAG: polymorphic toxin type 28 domain-containing protein [Candidatus Eremiobacteraeota bacterium]|nr:polymorphic toxin type 28 domain-containing protein [Candidatus Eremiobacteraeota bacterium]